MYKYDNDIRIRYNRQIKYNRLFAIQHYIHEITLKILKCYISIHHGKFY